MDESYKDHSRRHFIRMASFLTVSAAGLVLSGCGGGDDERPDAKREALAAGSWTFPSGVMSGDPRPTSIVLWTEIGRAAGNSLDGDVEVLLQVSRTAFDDPAHKESDLVVAHPLTAQARFGYTLRHRLEGLTPSTRYWYRFVVDRDRSVQGRTKTAPAAEATPTLRFAYLSCQDWGANHWDAYGSAADANRAYERRSRFTVYAAGAKAPSGGAIWPAFPDRVVEYENPAAIPAVKPPASSVDIVQPMATNGFRTMGAVQLDNPDLRTRIETALLDTARRHPSNPYAQLMADAVR